MFTEPKQIRSMGLKQRKDFPNEELKGTQSTNGQEKKSCAVLTRRFSLTFLE